MTAVSVVIVGDKQSLCEQVTDMLEFLDVQGTDVILNSSTRVNDPVATVLVCDDVEDYNSVVARIPESYIRLPRLVVHRTAAIDYKDVVPGHVECAPLSGSYRRFREILNRLQAKHDASSPSRRRRSSLQSLEGHSPAIEGVRKLIEKVANTTANVLILGESGTGKELVARAIHRMSDRSGQPFVPVNCGAIPRDLLESELFGHEKGAFTGAITTRTGRFELAEGGTLFLDEIGDMDFNMQVKLLRVLQEKTFEKVGSNKSKKADVRIIAATHKNLDKAILNGEFREDLYYRLNVFPIEMPPLRERKDDLPALAQSMIDRLASEHGHYRLDPQALQALMQHEWPGNVRELSNLIERLRILYPDQVVLPEDLPGNYTRNFQPDQTPMRLPTTLTTEPAAVPVDLATANFDLKQHLQEIEFDYIRQALTQTDGVVASAAKLLNLRRTTLVEKMRKYRIEREEILS